MIFNYRDPCLICRNQNKGCRHNRQGLYFCRIADSAPPGFRSVGSDTHGFGLYVMARGDYNQDYSRTDNLGRNKVSAELKTESRNTTSIEKRDCVYQQLPSELLVLHKAELTRRGLSETQIDKAVRLGVRSWRSCTVINADTTGVAGFVPGTNTTLHRQGFVIPARTVEGKIVGFQIANDNKPYIANDNKSYSKYQAISSSDPDKSAAWNLPTGESPLAIWNPGIEYDQQIQELWLVDGFLKSLIIYLQLLNQKRYDVCVIGAPGANAIMSPLQLKETITLLNPERIRLFPDAGDVVNPNVMDAHHKMHRAFEQWGVANRLSIAWWSQVQKGRHPDSDELNGNFSDASTDLDWKEFSSLGVTSDQGGFQHWRSLRQFTPLITLTQSELIDGKYFDFRAPEEGEMLAINSGLNTGKTQWLPRVALTLKIKLVIAPTNNLAIGIARLLSGELLQDRLVPGATSINRAVVSNTEGITIAPDSIVYINPADVVGKTIVIDEAAEVAKAFWLRTTAIKEYRHKAILRLRELMRAAHSVVLLDSNLTNAIVDWYSALADNKGVTKVFNPFSRKMGIKVALGSSASFQGSINKDSSFILGTDSKADARAFSRYSLDADSCKEDEWARAAMENPKSFIQAFKPRNMAFSPVASSGWNLSVEGAFERCYNYFCGINSIDGILQSLARYRDFNLPRETWIARQGLPIGNVIDSQAITESDAVSSVFKYICDLPALLADEPQALIERNQALIDNLRTDPTQMAIVAEIAALNYERKHYRACMLWALNEAGHQIDTYIVEKTEETEATRRRHRMDKADAKAQRAIEIIQAEDISSTEAKRIEGATTVKSGERAKLERYSLIKRLPCIQYTEQWNKPEFIKTLPVLARQAELFYLLLHPEILRRRGQNRYQAFLNLGKIDIAELKIQYTRISNLLNSGLMTVLQEGGFRFLDPREVAAGQNPQNVDGKEVGEPLGLSNFSNINEHSKSLVKFCSAVANGRGGEAIARGKRTRLEFLRTILKEFGLTLTKTHNRSEEYTISNRWIIPNSDEMVVMEAIIRRFAKLDGEE